MTDRVGKCLELVCAAEQAKGLTAGMCTGRADRSWQQRPDVLLTNNRRLERTCLRRRLEPELLVEPQAEAAVAAERFVLTTERIESEHLRAVRPFAEAVERPCCLGVAEGGSEVELGQGRVGSVQVGAENPALVAAADVHCPGGVRLVLEDLAVHEVECLLERGSGVASGFAPGALQELVEAVEVEINELDREAVRLRLGDDERARPLPIGAEAPPKCRDEGLQRAGDIPRPVISPHELGEAIDRDVMPARREQDLEDLLRPHAAEVSRAEPAHAVLDR